MTNIDWQTCGSPILGAGVYVRRFGVAVDYAVAHWVPPEGNGWRRYHGGWSDVWAHKYFEQHVVCVSEDRVTVAKMDKAEPDFASVFELGQLAVGGVYPSMYQAGPLSLRLPMKIVEDGKLELPLGEFREQRVLPVVGKPPWLVTIGNRPAEIRLSATRKRNSLRTYIELFPNGAFERRGRIEVDALQEAKRDRQSLFALDARNTPDLSKLVDPTPAAVQMVRELFAFAYQVRSYGLVIDADADRREWRMGNVVQRNGQLGVEMRLPIVLDVSPGFVPLS
jgi:hypothetical protein